MGRQLSHLSTNEPGYFDYSYIAPETRVAAQKLLLAVKSGKTPIKVIPGLTKEQLLMKRSDYVIAILRIMQETVKSKEKAASLFTNTRTLIVNGGTKLKYAYSPSERIYGIAIKGKGNKYRQTVSQLVKENVGSRTSELFEKLVDEQTSITFEQLVGKGSYCLYLDSTSESIRSKLKTIDTESLLDGIDSDETIKSINIRVSNDVPIVDLSLSTRRSSKAIPELEQSNIENTSAVIEIPSLWISFHTYAFTITKWCEKHGLPSSIRKKLQTIAASTFSEAKWQAGAMKDTVLFYDQKDVEDIDFSKKLPN